MKKITIALVLISLAGMALFAEGSQEETAWEPETGYMGRGQMPMNRGYVYPNQNFRGQGQMPTKGGNAFVNQRNMGPAGMGYTNPEFEIESLTFTGKIDLSDVNAPKLTVGEDTYELMVPYRLDYNIDIKDGDEITIIGFEVPAYRRSADAELTNLVVTGAAFEGTEYDLSMMNDGPMGYEHRPSMMNNYGPAYGQTGRFNKGGFQPKGMWNNPNDRPYRR